MTMVGLSQESKVSFILENQLMVYHINEWKKKNHIIPIGTKRVIDKTQHPFFILKTTNKLEIEEMFSINKVYL